ncbi:MAG: acetyl/propionyl/methylcrotonyl-CoA carboxylase subunit alpha [Alphaproteobacteria bacterium]|jgi:3-methylcrotonyl-CoA carboxylase alpha subunit|nr:acetyl/propionyl/methylcrotonyl-CoA carboxylase subunit alpha [Alphaproteobacteria bacterium]
MFDKILIANRGEIACRVIDTCRRLGVRTVAVYSDADAEARHVALADEAVHIGPAPARDSYLVIDRIIAAARRTGAQAIHPGYGFLSEKAEMARACAAAGLVFIGPPASAIEAMGLKGAAKALMQQAQVPVVPGYHGDDQDPGMLAAKAAEIGWPVLIKAVAGGGGKGMRRVDAAEDFAAALAGAQREAAASFGDDKVLIEKYLVKPRHIEIQVFGDTRGNAVYLFERDCSVQRRHQKVLEEAPAPDMPAEMRARMGEAAVAAAKAIGYVGAGTVEFIADVADGLRADRFYFMEMNTRLQVEHPVTEMITGQDLVEWQLRVAAGEALPLTQGQLAIDGHAIEARVYAEDPARNFLPSTGRLARLRPPSTDAHVRIDTGVREGDTVTPFYDPMIAKLIVWDRDRQGALRRMAAALQNYEIAGPTTNVAFLRRLCLHPAFAAGDLDTGFIERHRADLLPDSEAPSDTILALAALAVVKEREQAAREAAAASGDPGSPWARTDGWRLNDEGHDVVRLVHGGTPVAMALRYRKQGGYVVGDLAASATLDSAGTLEADLGGLRLRAAVALAGSDLTLIVQGVTWRFTLVDPFAAEDDEGGHGGVTSPMPGKVIQVLAQAGDAVAKGQPLLILEAMKMEHTIAAPVDGRIAAINAAVGEQVNEGVVLVAFEEDA